jgi:hypothetical protein
MPRRAAAVPVRVLLGDFLGDSGVIRSAGGSSLHGIRVETFAPSFDAPTFSVSGSTAGWTPPTILPAPYCIQHHSEWARAHTG